jgi:TrmH family RNA methyltransferase
VPEDSATGVIASRENARVVAARRLQQRKFRERERRFLIEGPHAVDAALRAGAPVVEVFHLWGEAPPSVTTAVRAAAERGVRCIPVTRHVLEALDTTDTPQGIVGVCAHLDVPLSKIADTNGLVPVLVEIQDPGNLGTVLRSADAAGAGGLALSHGSVDLYNPKVVRASAGSLFHLPVARDVPLAESIRSLRVGGFTIIASATSGTETIHEADLTGQVAVLFGNEAHGLPDEALALADRTVRIPIGGRAESLNLAAAATVVLFEAARQRSTHERPASSGG